MNSGSEWAGRIAEQVAAGAPLEEALAALLAQQRASWPLLREGEAGLAAAAVRRIEGGDGHVLLQANARRKISTSASVDPASVAQRPCFLCQDRLPAEERGVAFGDDYIAFCNPYPILPGHLSVVARQHRPQAIAGRARDLLLLSRSLGPCWSALYNGPRCGASAPDHLHFQAGQIDALPLEIDLDPPEAGAGALPFERFGRRGLMLWDWDAGALAERVEAAIEALQRIAGDWDEPLLNLIARSDDVGTRVLLFPRARHRPRQFFARGEDHLLISPGALDMAGLIVVAEPTHLGRVDAAAVRDIYDQVTLDAARFAQLAAAVET
ncbi:MAG: DUF4922 domain-containing protein [Deltaproteobacteria bacterium]|nr:DUF4922 domain-containing protein [Deltaproteobacteria bacterium]